MNSAKDRILKLVVEQAQLLGLLIEPSWDEDYSGGGSPEDVLVLNVIKKKHLIRFQKAELLRCDAGDEQVCDSIRALVYEELKELKGEVARP